MENATTDSKDVFHMPAAPRSPCEDGVSLTIKTPSSRAGSRKKLKSRAKSRGKSSSQIAPSSGQLSNSGNPSDASAMDVDLNNILNDLDGVEQRVTQILSALQKEVTAAGNFMLDCILAGILQNIDGVRCKIPDIHKMRRSNKAATSSLRGLDGIDRT